MTDNPIVYVVDDDAAFRDSLVWLIEANNHRVEAFASAEAFLAACHPGMAGCLVVDMRMPGLSGLELHDRLRDDGIELPTIVITGHGDVPMAVSAFRKGVVDFVEKPLDDGSVAVGLFNLTNTPRPISADWKELGLSGRQTVHDLWRQHDLGTFFETFSSQVPGHGVTMVRLTAAPIH